MFGTSRISRNVRSELAPEIADAMLYTKAIVVLLGAIALGVAILVVRR
jgi:hypothetical protein